MEDHQVLRLIAGFLPVHLPLFFAKACQERGFIPADNISATAQILSFPQQYQNQLLPAFLYLNH